MVEIDSPRPDGGRTSRPPLGAIVASLTGIAAAWIASGSSGMLGHAFRRGTVCTLLIAVVVIAWPRCGNRWARFGLLAIAAIFSLWMISSTLVPVNVLAVALMLLAVAAGQSNAAKKALSLAAEAVVLLALFRLACISSPVVWQTADGVGRALGRAQAVFTGRELWLGSTFAGLDFLVVSLYLAVMAPLRAFIATKRRRAFLLWVPAAVLLVFVGQMIYLSALSHADELAPASTAEATGEATPTGLIGNLAPWNVPTVGLIIQLVIVGIIFLSFVRTSGEEESPRPVRMPSLPAVAGFAWLVAMMAALGMLTTFGGSAPDLQKAKIVVFEEGFLNWLKPEHGDYGRLAIGMYGNFPTYVESLGGECLISPDLSDEDLDRADALILIYPNEPWKEGQLERIWKFVRDGGTLMVLGEHTALEEDGGNRFNEVLEPTNMRVRFDSATFYIGGWLESYDALSHPTSAGITDYENEFGSVIGASVKTEWPARPLLVGRWGWNDPGDKESGPAMMGNHRYDAGEKLGDVVLAAEQDFGKGRIIVFGDTSAFTNGLTIGCHEYTSRMLAYLVGKVSTPGTLWRQILALAIIAVAVGLLIWRPAPLAIAASSVALAASLVAFTAITHSGWTLLPNGSYKTPNNLAYIDTTHAEAFSRESWRPEGTMGLSLTLMRNGYLTMMLPEFTRERLLLDDADPPGTRARLLVSIAPTRSFTEEERETLQDFVKRGGIFICTVGFSDRAGSREMLADFDFSIGGDPKTWPSPGLEPKPLGHFKAPFFDAGEYFAYVRYHAAWLVDCKAPPEKQLLISQYRPGQPVIVVTRYEKGLIAVIGDTCFAMNKNLERRDGLPIEGMRENSDFWRWFLALLGEGESWYPPPPPGKETEDGSAAGIDDVDAVESDEFLQIDGDENTSVLEQFKILKMIGPAGMNPEETP